MNKSDVIKAIVTDSDPRSEGQAFACANIALCKYWGKRNSELNLPVTSSLSIGLGEKGSITHIKVIEQQQDQIYLNNVECDPNSAFSQRVVQFLELFRGKKQYRFLLQTSSNIPVAAGLASSASGFASLTLALDQLFQWQLHPHQLSILARLGSGSACRSIWPGFVEWQAGVAADGLDSYGLDLKRVWPQLKIGILMIDANKKSVSSRLAMQRTVATSLFYKVWPEKVAQDLTALKTALTNFDFTLLGQTAESNALAMHAMMLSSSPPVSYFLPETIAYIQKIWGLRDQGLSLYFTQDAGPNLKLLFLENDTANILREFPAIEIIHPFKVLNELKKT